MWLPISVYAGPQSTSASDVRNSLDTVGTKANRLKTVGDAGVDLSTGAFTFSYPMDIPKGKFGLQPDMSIAYNSQNAEENIIGFGMTFSLPYIERGNKNGSEKLFTSSDLFVSSLAGELVAKPGSKNQYVQKFDDGSYQLYTFSNSTWTMQDRTGNLYTYGQTIDSKICDDTCTNAARFYLNSVKDILGNQIKYYYEKKNGYVYPREIVYTVDRSGTYSNRIVFTRETRPDEIVSYKYGFLTKISERIKSVDAYYNGILTNKMELVYASGQNGFRSLLSKIIDTRKASDFSTYRSIATSFEFTKGKDISDSLMWNTYTPTSQTQYIDINGDAKPDSLNTSIDPQKSWVVIDVNGDYLPDMYSYAARISYMGWGYDGSNAYRKNVGGNFVNVPASSLLFPISNSTSNYIYDGNQLPTVTVSDINGDGLQDLIGYSVMDGGGTFLNNGKNFEKSLLFSGLGSIETILTDFNGDGLPDKIGDYTDPSNSAIKGKYVYLNNGKGWNTTPEIGMRIVPNLKIPGRQNMNQLYDSGVRFVDVNLDGLPDIIRSYSFKSLYTSYYNYYIAPTGLPYGDIAELYINTGRAFVKKDNPNFSGNYTVSYFQDTTNVQNPDQIQPTTSSVSENLNPKRVDVLSTITGPYGARTEISYKGTASENNNTNLPINILVVDKMTQNEVVSNQVTTSSYLFEGGKMYYDQNAIRDRRFAGFRKVSVQEGLKKTVNYFHQGDGNDVSTFERGDSIHLIGKQYLIQIFGGTETLFSRVFNTYGVYQYDGQIYRYPKSEAVTQFDSNGQSFSTATTYDYDLSSRLPKEIINYGQVNFDITNNTITDVGNDLIRSVLLSTNSRPQKFLSEEKYDKNGKFIDKTVNFYDNLPFGFIERGFLTETRNYRDDKNYTKTTYVYNPIGLPQSITDTIGNTTMVTYDVDNNPITKTNSLGQVVKMTYYNPLGQLTQIVEPNNKITTYNYDGFGNITQTASTNPKTNTTQIVSKSSYIYGVGNSPGITSTQNIIADGQIYNTITTRYDSFGRQFSQADSTGAKTETKYDTLGRIAQILDPSGVPLRLAYDDFGRVVSTQQGDVKVNTTYGLSQKRVYDNSSGTHAKTSTYDVFGQLTQVLEETSQGNYATNYSWNILGNLIKIQDADNNVRNFTYDAEGKLLKQEDLHRPDDTTFGSYQYTYDNLGNLITKTDPTGTVFTYSYDKLYRPLSESDGIDQTSYIYDTCSPGMLCQVKNMEYQQDFIYNNAGLVAQESKIIDSNTFLNKYTYNYLGQVASVILPDTSTLAYTYDINGKQKTVSLNGQPIVTDAKFNIDTSPSELKLANSIKTCYNYSTNNGGNTTPRLSEILVSKPNAPCQESLYNQVLSYDLTGSITSMREKYHNENFTQNTYKYDDLERLIKANDSVINYNPIGNILQAGGQNYIYDGSDYKNPNAASLIGTKRMTYDLNGNVLSDATNTYNWSTKNRMKTVSSDVADTRYTYDVSGERIKEKVSLKDTLSSTQSRIKYSETTVFSDTPTPDAKYVSKIAYTEIKELFPSGATIDAKAIKDYFMPVYNSDFVSKTCQNIDSISMDICLRETALKAFYVKIKSEKNVSLSLGALQEIWLVFSEKLQIPLNTEVYTSPTKSIIKTLNESTIVSRTYAINSSGSAVKVTSYEDFTYGFLCDMYTATNNDRMCGIILESFGLKNLTDYKVTKASLIFQSPYVVLDNVYKVSNLQNISTTQPHKFSVSQDEGVKSIKTGFINGYHQYTSDITTIVQKWTDFNTDYKNGLGISVVTPNSYQYIVTPNLNAAKTKITIDFLFIGVFNTFNTAQNTLVEDSQVDIHYSALINGQKIQTSNKEKPLLYLSEASYGELVKNNLTKINQINVLYEVAQDTDFLNKICPTRDTECIKKNSIKFVAGYLKARHNITLSATTLEEMWQVYRGILTIPQNVLVYEKIPKNGYLFNDPVSGCSQLNFNSQGCQIYEWFLAKNFLTPNARLYLTFDLNPQGGQQPFSLSMKSSDQLAWSTMNWPNQTEIFVTEASKTGNYTIDITDSVNSLRSWSNNGALPYGVGLNYYFYPKNASSGSMNISNMRMYMAEMVYKNQISAVPIVDTIDGLSDKAFLGEIYKEKKIASLFANPKLISKESFSEIQGAGLAYTNLVIYDRLIDYSFAPYAVCDVITDDDKKETCQKEIFISYLFAIAKYVRDIEFSPVALDEIYEAMQGNLTIPNNIFEYRIKETKQYTLSGTFTNTSIFNNGGYGTDPNGASKTSCEFGQYFNGTSWTIWCAVAIPNLPTELSKRQSELESAKLDANFSVSHTSTTFGYYVVPVAYSAPTVTINDTASAVADVANGTSFDVLNVLQSLLLSTSPKILRFSSIGTATLTTDASNLSLTVTYARDADQVLRAIYIPLVLNPKDADVYSKVLSVLARIDRDVVTASNSIISKVTYDEVKNTWLKTNDDVMALFVENEKLQKDQTLAAVWSAILSRSSIKITREALEELYLVWQNKLSMPVNSDNYTLTPSLQVFDRNTLEILSVVPGVPSTRTLLEDITFTKKYTFSTATIKELTSSGYAFVNPPLVNVPFTKANKLDVLKQLYIDTLKKRKVALSREALEEIYYFIQGKLVFPLSSTPSTSTPSIVSAIPEFSRSTLGMLEPILVDGQEIASVNENNADDNIVYNLSGIGSKIISDDTRQELAIVGITTKAQITTIMKGTNTLLKDSKLGFFAQYAKDKLGYEFSREALEEIYMLYIGQAILGVPNTTEQVTEINTYMATKPEWSGSSASCVANYIGGAPQYNTSCTIVFNTPQKEGYTIVSEDFSYMGAQPNNLGAPVLSINGTTVPIKTTPLDTPTANYNINLMKYAPSTGKIIIMLTYTGPYATSFGLTPLAVTLTYRPIVSKFDRADFASLSSVSTIDELIASYLSEETAISYKPPVPSITSKVLTTPETLAELSRANILLTKDISTLFSKLDPKLTTKEAKLYGIFLAVKTASSIELSRQALEEIWNISQQNAYLQTDKTPYLQPNITANFLYKRAIGNTLSAYVYGGTTYVTTDSTASNCSILAYADSACFFKFGITQKPGWEAIKATLNFNYGGPNYYPSFTMSAGVPKSDPNVSKKLEIDTTSAPVFSTPATYGNYVTTGLQSLDVTDSIKKSLSGSNTSGYDIALYRNNNGGWGGVSWSTYYFMTSYDGYASVWGVKDPSVSVVWKHIDPFVGIPVFDTVTIYEMLSLSTIDKLKSFYNTAMGIVEATVLSTTTLATTSVPITPSTASLSTPTTLVSPTIPATNTGASTLLTTTIPAIPVTVSADPSTIKETPTLASSSTTPETPTPATIPVVPQTDIAPITLSTTLTPIDLTLPASSTHTPDIIPSIVDSLEPANETNEIDSVTQVSPTPPTNPYNYAWKYDDITQSFIYYLPDGTTTTNPLFKPVTTIADFLIEKLTAQKDAKQLLEYTVYYPNSYYQYDTRGVITINIPFNGQVVAQVRYVDDTIKSPSSTDPDNMVASDATNTSSSIPSALIPPSTPTISTTTITLSSQNLPTKSSPEITYLSYNYQGSPVIATDKTGAVIQSIKYDEWGNTLDNTIAIDIAGVPTSNPTNFGYTGHRFDLLSSIVYAHARYLNTGTHTWLSQDPVMWSGPSSQNLSDPQSFNAYSYAGNNPVGNTDPNGLLAVIIPGTWFKTSNWLGSGTGPLRSNVAASFPGQTISTFTGWSGGDNSKARSAGAKALAKHIDAQYEKSKTCEPLNIITHSHGGNVAAEYSNMKDSHPIKNLITLGEPVRNDYTFNEDKIANHINVYSKRDLIQGLGGGSMTASATVGLLSGGLVGYIVGSRLGWGEFGVAGRKVNLANNQNATKDAGSWNIVGNHSKLYTNPAVWNTYVKDFIK